LLLHQHHGNGDNDTHEKNADTIEKIL
jgi:hypothetical protein